MNVGLIQLVTPDGCHDVSMTASELALPLSELLARRGFPLNTRCGGRGLCAGCEVELRTGALRCLGDDTPPPAGA